MRRALARVLATAMLIGSIQLVGSPAVVAGGTPQVDPVKTGLNGPSAFTFAPNGFIWYLERGTGRIIRLNPGTGGERRTFRISRVDGSGERGALGIALHPNWPATKLIYVYVTRMAGGSLRNQVVRVNPDANRMRVLISTPASSIPYHNGGRILFGPDGKLYVTIGDGHNESNAQDRTRNLRGKVLRLDPDGTPAPGNPFGRVWAYGIRNSFGFTFDPQTDRLWETQNGPGCNDEINRIVKGGNFAWGPHQSCGSLPTPRDTNRDGPTPRRLPEKVFVSPIGITGAAFCNSCGLGASFEGKLLYGAVNDGMIRMSTLGPNRRAITATTVVTGAPNGIHSMEVAPNGAIYFSDFAAIYRLIP